MCSNWKGADLHASCAECNGGGGLRGVGGLVELVRTVGGGSLSSLSSALALMAVSVRAFVLSLPSRDYGFGGDYGGVFVTNAYCTQVCDYPHTHTRTHIMCVRATMRPRESRASVREMKLALALRTCLAHNLRRHHFAKNHFHAPLKHKILIAFQHTHAKPRRK